MAGPLVWKSTFLCNVFYDTLLRYPCKVRAYPLQKMYHVEKEHRKLIPFYLWFTVFLLMFASCCDMTAKSMTMQNISQNTSNVILTTGVTLIAGLCIAGIAILIPQAEYIVYEYYNPLVKYELHFTRERTIGLKFLPSWKGLLKHGNEKTFNIFKRNFQNILIICLFWGS